MGREIHDSTMQQLSALGLAVSQLKRTRLPGESLALVDDIEELLFDAQRELRSIAYLAHPPQLSRMDLSEAVRTLVEGFGRRAGLITSFEVEGETDVQWQNARVAIYRVLQEALSNVHRHAHATQLSVRLIGRKSMIHLIVADNGRGMPVDVSPGVGLLGMRARLAELGGRLIVRKLSPGTAVIGSVQRT
nr:ATP-binding protein [Croceibacterium selenioxidans]